MKRNDIRRSKRAPAKHASRLGSTIDSTLSTIPKKPHVITHHEHDREDDYFWLRDRSNPQVKRILRQENDHVESFFQKEAPQLRRSLFLEMKARWKEEDASLPTLDRNYWYYTRTIPNAEYPIYCRRPFDPIKGVNANFSQELSDLWRVHPDAPLPFYEDEVVFLDLNLLVQELRLDFTELGDLDISPDETQVAVTLDCSNGKEIFTLFVLPATDNVSFSAWLPIASTIERGWVTDQEGHGRSRYELPRRSPASSTAPSKHSAMGSGSPVPSIPPCSPGGMSSASPTTEASDGTNLTAAISPAWESPVTPIPATRPAHRVLHRIDMFDLSSEVLWIHENALMYVGMDELFRPFQIVHHNLLLGDEDAAASLVCFQEESEAFWVSSISFTVDRKFLVFSTASSDASEWFLSPLPSPSTEYPFGIPYFSGVPMVPMGSDDPNPELTALIPETERRIFTCFSPRCENPGMEYEVDHHVSLLGPNAGSWIITSNAHGCTNFGIFIAPDSDHDGFSAEALRPDAWIPLFKYDASTKVEGVECYQHHLIVSIRRGGAPTALFCPVSLLWSWWESNREATSKPLLLGDLVDVSCLVEGMNVWSSWSPQCFNVADVLADDRSRVTALGSVETISAECGLGDVHCTALPVNVEVYSCDAAFTSTRWRVSITHLLRPAVLCEMEYLVGQSPHGELHLRKVREEVIRTPYDPQEYAGMVVWVPSTFAFDAAGITPIYTPSPAETVSIPVIACWKRSAFALGTNPMIAHVYGSYGSCSDSEFSTERLSLLQRGFVWASALVRGGGELGIPWRDAGRKAQRATTVNDFVSVCAYLQHIQVCEPGRLLSCGSSAGGMVVFRAMTLAPQCFLGVLGAVPFVDCLTSLLDADMPLTVSEWEEYGNPIVDPKAYEVIRSISPMDTLPLLSDEGAVQKPYPHIFLQTSWDDSRVGFWESLKLLAKLRDLWPMLCGEETRQLLHFCDFGSGHGGSSGRYQQLKEIAREYAVAIVVAFGSNWEKEGASAASAV